MDFDFTDEQRLLRDSVAKLFANRYGDFEKRNGYAKQPDGFDRAIWTEYAEVGLLALPFDEKHGGFGGGPVETMIVMEEIGKNLALEPYLPSVVFAGAILRHGASDAVKDEIIPKIAAGEAIIAVAHTERQSRYDLNDVTTTARRDGDGYVIEGDKTVVIGGNSADYLIVSARMSGARRDRDGIALFLVDAKAEGVSRRGYAMQDGLHGAEVSLANVRVPASRRVGNLPVLERAADEAIAAVCAEAVGVMEALIAMTVDYMKTRKQFGVAISVFQALQHRAVDMYVAAEQARSMAIFAALSAASDDAKERGEAMAMAKSAIGKAARFVGQQAIQLHGGIGMTMEYKAGHLFKRLTMIDLQFGDADHHLRRLAA
ncbi:acyl-CoA dehydrogenase [Acidiphilium sp. AL]|uniref:Acyl-CoA dehydrogenase n=1 Tax=Acidiphilium iwatense TaxID=768198 RepID=A0ABS9DVV2_9PROT|nr:MULTISPECIES: acyl-CoA dehydrogenase [Acidiphilium]MCF3945910.1 acyl-CoA dehydrogenase [Acidiphilium iwatense]MCU4159209.1 acyl-CoA dehydrogenase [Acidiphilium sp. AL]